MNDWENPALTGRNRLEPHAWLEPSEGEAYRKLLNGQWDFVLASRPDAVGDAIVRGEWKPIRVPGVWQLQGYGHPHYTNFQFPFPVDPPFVPSENDVGVYRRQVTVPASWEGRPLRLRFEGVDSAFWVFVDGHEVGFSKGSRLVHEFDLTPFVHGSVFELQVRVVRWSDGSYLEDQDHWWLSGIFRDVWLLAPPRIEVYDAFVEAGWDVQNHQGRLLIRYDIPAAGAVQVGVVSLRLADFQGHEVWTSVGSLTAAEVSAPVPEVLPWSAESPVLYTLRIAVKDHRGRELSVFCTRVGFRTITRQPHAFLVNGKRIMIKGMNRHDSHPRLGRVTPIDHMRKDLLLMKAHNINAIRTSHYPNDRHFFDLCDELGFYVMAECDLETHGFTIEEGKNPSEWPQWGAAYLDRMTRLVETYKNHPCILFWSLGNESSFGINHEAMASWTRDGLFTTKAPRAGCWTARTPAGTTPVKTPASMW